MLPGVPELVEFFVWLEDSIEGRSILDRMPDQVFRAAVEEGLVEQLEPRSKYPRGLEPYS